MDAGLIVNFPHLWDSDTSLQDISRSLGNMINSSPFKQPLPRRRQEASA